MGHDYHQGQPNYNRKQLFHDGCAQCKSRAESPSTLFDHVDMREAWARAVKLGRGELEDHDLPISDVELPVLRMMWSMIIGLERHGLPIGSYPPDVAVVLGRARQILEHIKN